MLVQGTGTHGPAMAPTAFSGGQSTSVTELHGELATLDWQAPATATKAAPARDTMADKRAEARMKGYVGEACPECANFTLVRNGTCLKCDTCGSTTGCS